VAIVLYLARRVTRDTGYSRQAARAVGKG